MRPCALVWVRKAVIGDTGMATNDARVREILATVKLLAAEYYRLTGKPLGVTGEIAEYVAAELLGLALVEARTAGHDAIRDTPFGRERIQIKGRAYDGTKPGQRLGRIKLDAACDTVILVLLDNATLEPREMWEAPYGAVRQSAGGCARMAEMMWSTYLRDGAVKNPTTVNPLIPR